MKFAQEQVEMHMGCDVSQSKSCFWRTPGVAITGDVVLAAEAADVGGVDLDFLRGEVKG